jgi:hypothetical protein
MTTPLEDAKEIARQARRRTFEHAITATIVACGMGYLTVQAWLGHKPGWGAVSAIMATVAMINSVFLWRDIALRRSPGKRRST